MPQHPVGDDFAIPDAYNLSYLHKPFLNPYDYLRARELLLPPLPEPPMPWVLPTPRPERVLPRDDLVFNEWEHRHITPAERDVWMDAGLERHEARIADMCRRHGVRPSDLQVVVDGRRVVVRLRGGESVPQIIARLRNATA